MLKRLAVIGLWLAVAPIVSGQPNKTANGDKQPTKQAQPAVIVADTPDKKSSGQTYQAKSSSNSPAGNTSLERPHWWAQSDWWLVGIAFFTGCVICWQSIETRKAAQGAFLNAQVVINSERPWIMATVEEVEGPMGGFNLYVTNKGRTPAMITGAYLGSASVKDVSALPEKAPYFRGNMAKDRIILPDEKHVITWFDGGTLKKLVGEGFSVLAWEGQIFVFGKILYRDLLSASPKPPHETRWIGRYQFPTEDFGDSIFSFQGIGIPDEYDRYS